jgi:kinetochore protein Spc7/SPC105
MSYKREIELVFDVASFQPIGQQNSRIDLWYLAASRERDAQPATVEKEFFLQCIRDHVRGLQQSRTSVSTLLGFVATAWDLAGRVANGIRLVNVTFPTTVTKTGDSSVDVTVSLLLRPIETKVEIVLRLKGSSGLDGVRVGIEPSARVVYGEHFNVPKICEFLSTRLGGIFGEMEESWSDVVVELYERLLARGRKAPS